MFLILYPRQLVLLLLFCGLLSLLLLLFLFFFSLVDHQALRDWLRNMSTLPLDVKVLRHSQQLQHLLRKLSPADIVAGEAKYIKSVFLHSSVANLNLCLTNARVKSDA